MEMTWTKWKKHSFCAIEVVQLEFFFFVLNHISAANLYIPSRCILASDSCLLHSFTLFLQGSSTFLNSSKAPGLRVSALSSFAVVFCPFHSFPYLSSQFLYPSSIAIWFTPFDSTDVIYVFSKTKKVLQKSYSKFTCNQVCMMKLAYRICFVPRDFVTEKSIK